MKRTVLAMMALFMFTPIANAQTVTATSPAPQTRSAFGRIANAEFPWLHLGRPAVPKYDIASICASKANVSISTCISNETNARDYLKKLWGPLHVDAKVCESHMDGSTLSYVNLKTCIADVGQDPLYFEHVDQEKRQQDEFVKSVRLENEYDRSHPQQPFAIATFTPPNMSGMQWNKLGESSQQVVWYAYERPYIAIKIATKGVGNGYSGLSVIFGTLMCGAQGAYPQSIQQANVFQYDPYNGMLLNGDSITPFGSDIPIMHDSIGAKAVIASCDSSR